MADEKISASNPISQEPSAVQRQRIEAQLESLSAETVEQVATEKDLEDWCDSGFNPVAITRNFRSLDELKPKKKETSEAKEAKSEEDEELISLVGKAELLAETASRFQANNPELSEKLLLLLRNSLRLSDSAEDILKKVLSFYSDYTLADEALDYLSQTTSGELALKVLEAKELLNARFGREIRAGKNISGQIREFSEKGLGSPTALRDMYRDITGNPRTPLILFDQLSNRFPYEKMKTVIHFLLHSIGSDLKAKGPSITRAELTRLLDDTRTLQAILGVYRFFKSRMSAIKSQFVFYDLKLPSKMNFENLSKAFIALFNERYPSSGKLRPLANFFGITDELEAQVVLFNQLRDAIRQVSPRLYKNDQQKQDLLKALLDTLEELEEELEKEDVEEEGEEKDES